jgi:hypothetical protein
MFQPGAEKKPRNAIDFNDDNENFKSIRINDSSTNLDSKNKNAKFSVFIYFSLILLTAL